MKSKEVGGVTMFFDSKEGRAAVIVEDAIKRSVEHIKSLWRIKPPKDCRVVVMTSWWQFVLGTAPWYWKAPLFVLAPLWAFRVRRLWRYAGGWTFRYRDRQVVGVKPAHLIEEADRSLGDQIFVRVDDMDEKVRHITCHELVHGFTGHLKLPAWLNEGLAMMTVDRFFEVHSVKRETLETLESQSSRKAADTYRRLAVRDPKRWVYLYVRGYWITRYLMDKEPGLIIELLQTRRRRKKLETMIAARLGMEWREFWKKIDDLVVSHFEGIYMRRDKTSLQTEIRGITNTQ